LGDQEGIVLPREEVIQMLGKLKCDRCGVEYTDEPSIKSAIQMKDEWEAMVRANGDKPRGICPCPNLSCSGELILTEI
jgi:hypothetical protein